MSTPPRERIEELLAESRTRELSAAERSELNAALRTDANARQLAARWLLDDAALSEELRAAQVERIFHEDAATPAATPRSRLPWRPLAAAAAGIVFGLFCASVAWSYAGSRALEVCEQAVPIADGDFEAPTPPAADGTPTSFGAWSGDFASVTAAEQGIQPKSGSRMLRVERSFSRTDPPELDSHGGDMMQLVDLRALKASFASGNAVLEASASGNMVAPKPDESFSFAVTLMAFAGRPEELGTDARELAQSALAAGTKRVQLDADPATWQTALTRLLLPADADFVLVKFTMTRRHPRPPGSIEFAGHYADDVRLVLKTQPASPLRVVAR